MSNRHEELAREWPKLCEYAPPGTVAICTQQHDVCERVFRAECSMRADLLRRVAEEAQQEVVHQCPPKGSGLTPCCGKTPFELPPYHRMTRDRSLVTCHVAELSAAREQEQKWYESFHREMCRADDAESALVAAREQVRRLKKALIEIRDTEEWDAYNPAGHENPVEVARAALAETAQPEEEKK